jgi:hypothetical protein
MARHGYSAGFYCEEVGCILGEDVLRMGDEYNWLRNLPVVGFDVNNVEPSGSAT